MDGYKHIDHGFEPVFDARSRVLVLGSFPSVLSRANDFYYGNPQNRFWRVIARCCSEPVPPNKPLEASIAAKKALLLRHGIALWDVIASCDIKGSSDASIRNVVPADVGRILQVVRIETVFANGRTAEKLYKKHLLPVTGLPATGLPSTSPANAAWGLERLYDRWSEALGPYLD